MNTQSMIGLLFLVLMMGSDGARIMVDIAASSSPVGEAPIHAMQWSPHWKCFAGFLPFQATCKPKVEELLAQWLGQYELDFVNLGMFTDPEWLLPPTYGSFDAKCMSGPGPDNVKFLYDKTKWEVPEWQLRADDSETVHVIDREEAAEASDDVKADWAKDLEDMQKDKQSSPKADDMFGCANINNDGRPDRVYGVVAFQRTDSEEKVIVVVGHLPHPPGGSSSSPVSVAGETGPVLTQHMGAKIAHIKSKPDWGAAKVMLVADLNNDIDAPRPAVFDNPEKMVTDPTTRKMVKTTPIEEAFKAMDPVTVGMVKKMEKQILGADGKPNPATVGEALEEPNKGWTKAPFMSNEEVWESLTPDKLGSSTELKGTCCADKVAMVEHEGPEGDEEMLWPEFPYAFDRIMASFGPLQTIMPLEELLRTSTAEDRAELVHTLIVGAFHMPIIAKVGN